MAGNAQAMPGNELVEFCTAKETSTDKVYCYGFFRGFISYHKIIQPKTCFPVGTSYEQIVKVFLRYADTHPEELHMDSFVLIMFALNDAWPCEENN